MLPLKVLLLMLTSLFFVLFATCTANRGSTWMSTTSPMNTNTAWQLYIVQPVSCNVCRKKTSRRTKVAINTGKGWNFYRPQQEEQQCLHRQLEMDCALVLSLVCCFAPSVTLYYHPKRVSSCTAKVRDTRKTWNSYRQLLFYSHQMP